MKKLFFHKVFILLIVIFLFGQYQIHSQQNQNSTSNQNNKRIQEVAISHPIDVSIRPNVEELEADKNYRDRQENRDKTNAYLNERNFWLNTFLFIAILATGGISFFQLKSMRQQAQTMQDTLKTTKDFFYIDNRAYMAVIDVEFEHKKLIVGKHSNIKAFILNGGKTPAYDVTARCRITVSSEKNIEKENPKITDFKVSNFVVAGKQVSTFAKSELVMYETMFSELKYKESTFYVFIDLFYKDFQKNNQTDTFKFQYDIDREVFVFFSE
jgi:hypothetical protein